MANLRRTFQSALILCLLCGLNAATRTVTAQEMPLAPEPSVQPGTIDTHWQTYQEIPDSYELAAENETFQLYVDRSSLAFKVLDKRSGYIWHSNLDEVTKEDKLNKTWTAFARSGISIDYLDPKAVNQRLSITNSNTTLDVRMVEAGFAATVDFTDAAIKLDVIVTLEPEGVRVEIPAASIVQENPDFKLGQIYVYPFFGATLEDSVPGYMFIPDGAGSLIRFAATTKARNMYYGRYYGPDLGMIAALPYDRTVNRAQEISFPVFGMVHGEKQNAFLSIVESGASYGELQAHPAGIITRFNFLYSAFIYNESYFQATNRSGAGVTTLQPETNVFDVKIHYRFLTGDDSDYVGMAQSYQQYLLDNGTLNRVTDEDSDIGIRLEFLGGDKKRVLLWSTMIEMTTVEQMRAILDDLAIQNADVIYYGWQPLGASNMPPDTLKLDRNLGTVEQLSALAEEIDANGGNFHLYLDPQAAFMYEGGYSPRYDLAMSITNFNLLGYNRGKLNYYLNYDALEESYSTLSADVFTELQAGLALDGIGSILYSDFKDQNRMSRETAIEKVQSLLAEYDGLTAFYTPNDYLFGAMDTYYDIPLGNNGYIYTTEAVPFLQIVLAGYVPYYGPALNFSSNLREDLLKQIDYGVYPSFFLTEEVTAKILDTNSNWIYTSSYNQWGQDVTQTYEWLNSLLGPVKGQEIVARQVLRAGVVATTYANGKQIIVNYTDRPYYAGGLVVNAKDAALREVAP